MKRMKSFSLLFAALMFMPMVANAYKGEALIEGIIYYINTEAKTAEVRANSGNSYYGDIVIPEIIEYDGVICYVTSIGERAFYLCNRMTSVIIPNSVTTIGDYAFQLCLELTSVTIGNSVTTIGANAFASCIKLPSITIPQSVTAIGEGAFWNCNSLKDVYCFAENVPSTHSEAFGETKIEDVTLHVLDGSGSAYENTAPWSQFGSIVEVKKCATPTITYQNGKVRFACKTEGVELVPSLTCTPRKLLDGNEMEIGGNFAISVYAVKEGYENSEVATKIVTMSQMGDIDGDGQISVSDITSLVNNLLGK